MDHVEKWVLAGLLYGCVKFIAAANDDAPFVINALEALVLIVGAIIFFILT